jgi:DNA-binding NarL/FixJ family response regulator
MTAQPSQSQQEPLTPLSEREREVMLLYSNPFMEKSEIAARLNISMNTVNFHIAKAFEKLGEADRFTAAWRFWELYPECWDRVKQAIREAA